MKKLACKSLYFVLIILSLMTHLLAEDYRIVGDIEGIAKRFFQLEKEGVIKKNANGNWDLVEGKNLIFEGDLWKRGPYGIRTVKWVQDLLTRYNDPKSSVPRVALSLGNHDLNTISLIQWLPGMEQGQLKNFNKWLAEKKLPNSLTNRIDYWAEWNGVHDKINWFWLEKVAEKLNVDPLDPAFAEKYYPKFKPNVDLLSSVIGKDAIYQDFHDFVKPGSPVWDLYRKGKVVQTWVDNSGAKFLTWHSGNLSQANFGVVPGNSFNYFDYERLMSLPASQAKKEASLGLVKWTEDYNGYVGNQLNEIEKNWRDLKGLDGNQPVSTTSKSLKVSKSLLENRMAALADAGWDPVTKKLNYEANSLVYPDPRTFKDNSIPGLPEQKIVDILGLAELDYGASGHQPVGEGMIHRTAIPKNGYPVQLLLTDTSFSVTEQEDRVYVKDGELHFQAKTREGLDLVINRPSNKIFNEWKKEVASFKALKPEELVLLPPDEVKRLKELAHKVSAFDKLGMIANGWLVTGFQGKINPATGLMEADLDQFILFQKNGYKIEYKKVDVWGIEGAKLEPAVADLRQMALNASQAKVDELKAHGKQVLSTKELLRTIKGKKIMITSGPALNSMNKALKNPEAEKMLPAHLLEFENWLKSIPASDEWVFMGGGTQGFEEERNKVVAKINLERIQAGKKPFEIVGLATGITGGSELDLNVKKYFNLKAFYWDDYQQEMLNLLDNKANRPESIVFDFAGGGGIVTQQLKETAAFIAKGNDAKIHLIPGLNPHSFTGIPNADDLKKMAATDSFIHTDLGKQLVSSKIATVIKPGAYQSDFGEKGQYSLKTTISNSGTKLLKVGVLTGTFDPPHLGHKQLAQDMKKHYGLDVVYFVPADIEGYKPGKQSLSIRNDLLKIMIKDDPNLQILPEEIARKVKGLHGNGVYKIVQESLSPQTEVFGIMGEDTFKLYREYNRGFSKNVKLLVQRRAGVDKVDIPKTYNGASVDAIDGGNNISSSGIKSGTILAEEAMTAEMKDYIKKNNLYVPKISGFQQSNRFGRVLRGRSAEDFKTMSDDTSRKIIFFMDEKQLVDAGNTEGDKLLPKLGYTDSYIDDLKSTGHQFKLVGFNAQEGQVLPATWDNIMKLIEQSYPKEVADKVRLMLPKLKTIPFGEIEKTFDKTFSSIYSKGKIFNEYMTSDRLSKIKNPTLWDVRAFLYNELRLSELYSGDGFTYLPDGTRGIPEYIGLNRPIDKLTSVSLSDVQVSKGSVSISRLPSAKPAPVFTIPQCENGFSKLVK